MEALDQKILLKISFGVNSRTLVEDRSHGRKITGKLIANKVFKIKP